MKFTGRANIEMLNCDCMDGMRKLEDKSQHVIMVDPPYFQVKGKFDFQWKSFEDYLKDVDMWAKECKRLLADNGTLFWWGHAKKIAYSQIILDKYFNLENSLVWEKQECQTNIGIEGFRSFAPVTERCLMYSNEVDMTGREFIEKEFISPRNPFAIYLKEEFKKANVSNIDIAKLFPSKTGGLTGCVSNWLNGDNVITKEQYLKIRNFLNNEYLRKEYEDLRRPFNNEDKLTDVLKFSQEGHITGKYNHPTQKPPKLIYSLLKTCSRPDQNLLVPFLGSGVDLVCAWDLKLNTIGFEKDKEYFESAVKRFEGHIAQKQMF